MKSIFRVFSYLKRYPKLAGLQLFCAIGMTAALFFFPAITGYTVDEILPNPERHHEALKWVLIAFGAFAVRASLDSARIFINNHFEQKVIFDIRSDLYGKVQTLPLNWFDTQRTGDVMTRVVEDVTSMERVLIDGVEQGVIAILQVFGFGIWLYVLNFQVAAWATLPIPFLAFGAYFYATRGRDRYRNQREATSDLNSFLHDNIAGIRQIKSYAAEDVEHRRFNGASEKLKIASLRMMRWWAIYSPSMSFVKSIGYVLVLGFGGAAVMDGSLTEGEFITFLVSLSLFYDPIDRLNSLNQMLLSGRAAADRVFEILDADEEIHANDGRIISTKTSGAVEFRNVSFAYQEQATLNGISISAKPGQTIALVGTTGAGKTTVLSLLARFYEKSSGEILLDGTDIGDANKPSLRNQLAYVTQEPFLFNDTVAENLRLAKRDATDDELWKALKLAYGESFVRELPKQLETYVGERGLRLSGGEKQRLSIARALLKNAPILLLDEATASVDSETEHQIQKALDHLMENRTAFVIAHRLSTIQNADRIYVLEKGQVVEEGTHTELLALGGKYSELSKRSFISEQTL